MARLLVTTMANAFEVEAERPGRFRPGDACVEAERPRRFRPGDTCTASGATCGGAWFFPEWHSDNLTLTRV
jgi:hypothetical protein